IRTRLLIDRRLRHYELLAGAKQDIPSILIRRMFGRCVARTGIARAVEDGALHLMGGPVLPLSLLRVHGHAAFDNCHRRTTALAIDIEQGADGSDLRRAAGNDEWALVVLRDIEQRLTLQQLDASLILL